MCWKSALRWLGNKFFKALTTKGWGPVFLPLNIMLDVINDDRYYFR